MLESITFPEPVISVAIEAKSSADKDKIESSLILLQKEDPSCRVHKDTETGQTLLQGMGELHLDILIDRLKREKKVHLNVGKPQVSFREAPTQKAKGTGVFEKEIGGQKHFASCQIEITPIEEGFILKNHLKESIPLEFSQTLETAFTEVKEIGVIAGYGMTHLQIDILSANFHEGESTEMAYRMAAVQAFRQACEKAKPRLMEPIFKIEISSPEEFVGNVIGDLNSRRGRILSTTAKKDIRIVQGEAPLINLFGYATDIRSLSQGRASFNMEFKEYTFLSEKVEEEILKKAGHI